MLSAASVAFVSCYLPPDGPCYLEPLLFVTWMVEASRVGSVKRSYLAYFLVVVGVLHSILSRKPVESRFHFPVPIIIKPPGTDGRLAWWLPRCCSSDSQVAPAVISAVAVPMSNGRRKAAGHGENREDVGKIAHPIN